MWRSEDTLWDSVLVFHHAGLGNKLKLTSLEPSTFTHWPRHLKSIHLGTYCWQEVRKRTKIGNSRELQTWPKAGQSCTIKYSTKEILQGQFYTVGLTGNYVTGLSSEVEIKTKRKKEALFQVILGSDLPNTKRSWYPLTPIHTKYWTVQHELFPDSILELRLQTVNFRLKLT